MKTLELKLKKDVLIVDLPQKFQNFKEATITNNVLFADGKGNRTCLFIIFGDKLDNEDLNEFLKKGLKRIVLDYIEGEFEYKCKGSELTEEIASKLVEEHYMSGVRSYEIYNDYRYNDSRWLDDAKESFISAVESKGFHWFENPIDEPNKYVQRCMSFENLSNQFKLFDEKEEKTFRNPLIFVKKS